MTIRSLLLVCCVGLVLSACDGSSTIGTAVDAHSASVWQNRADPRATISRPGFLYWSADYSEFQKIRLSDGKEFRRRAYGADEGLGLAVDRHGNVYQAFGNAVDFGVSVLNKKLQLVRTIDTAKEGPSAVAFNGRGEVYALCENQSPPFPYSIEVFASNASGSATPIRTIAGARTGFGFPSAVAVDAEDYVYVANRTLLKKQPVGIEVFSPHANGNRKPLRTIAGDQTGIIYPVNITLGADENIYVANVLSQNGSGGDAVYDILVFPTNADGNVAPTRVLQSGAYGYTLALGTAGELYLGSDPFPAPPAPSSGGAFAIYAPGASGNDQPIGYLGAGSASAFTMVLEHPWYLP